MMRKRIVVFVICFVSLCFIVGTLLTSDAYVSRNTFLSGIHFTVKSADSSQEINIWHDQSRECYYAFLPSYAALDSVYIDGWPHRYSLAIDHQSVDRGETLSDYALNTEYAVTLTHPNNQIMEHGSLVIMRSANIPAMYIMTECGSLDHINSDKSNKDSGYMALYAENDEAVFSGSLQYIKGRGQTSWKEDKKSYKIKLSKQSDLLGLGSASVWVLQANAKDDSYLQNKITFDIADQLGLISSASDFIDLYVDGAYIGNYLLCEQPEIGRDRVDITGPGTLPNGDVSGGYLLEVCDGKIMTDTGNGFDVKEPDRIASGQLKDIADFLQEAEDAVFSTDGYNPITGKHYTEYIDLDSLVKKYLILEFSKSFEGGRTSDYFYTDINTISPRLYSGPVWDFDSAYGFRGVGGTLYSSPLGITRIALSSSRLNWYPYLYEKQNFLDSAKSIYYAEFIPVIQQVLDYFTVYEDTIKYSAALDQVRWGKDRNRFMARCRDLRRFMEERLEYLSLAWSEDRDFAEVYVIWGKFSSYVTGDVYAVGIGDALGPLEPPVHDGFIFQGWYYSDTDTEYDPDAPVTGDISICAKWERAKDSPISISASSIINFVTSGINRDTLCMTLFILFLLMFLCLLAVDMRRHWKKRRHSKQKRSAV